MRVLLVLLVFVATVSAEPLRVRVLALRCEGRDTPNNHHGHDYYVMGRARLRTDGAKVVRAVVLGGRTSVINPAIRGACRQLQELVGVNKYVFAQLAEDDVVEDGPAKLDKITIDGRALNFDAYADEPDTP